MKLYQIVETAGEHNHAGSKATKDVAQVAERLGFQPLAVKMCTQKRSKMAKVQRQIGFFRDWNRVYRAIAPDSVVLLQHPFHYPQLTRVRVLNRLVREKQVRFISLVHDVEELRAFRFNAYYKKEFEDMLALTSAIIVHNEKMAAFFRDRGVPEKKLVVLEIFDYLQSDPAKELPRYAKQITVAGNLDVEKCGYIGQLHELEGVRIQLYGPNFDEGMRAYPNIHYGGSLPSDEIPHMLNTGFGLVWDGAGIDGCIGQSGQYLRYNNPHKLSLYLSSGLPVVIWSEAAEAGFVREHQVGMVVHSLRELPERMERLTEEEYLNYARNAQRVAADLTSGKYAEQALGKALRLLEEQA